ncbi:MAG: hypothetical protein CVV07_04155 [Gammaproteobacteria bacterium HGW-Gammaproteobacteria-11]|nr:MAG: hypothetical protein CVV07_04155 [Gammaproteobacteria bacterium HGW-Gammaproteobacteria-11]
MTQRDPSEPSRLLKDLESIRTLLDEQAEEDAQTPAPPQAQMDIPLLNDVIAEPLATEANPGDAQGTAVLTPAAGPKPNPFLPYDQLARLAEERMQLDRLMAGHTPPAAKTSTPPPYNPHTGAREVRIEARLRAEAQLIMQDVIDDLIPTIEAELRNRLQGKIEQIVKEQLK